MRIRSVDSLEDIAGVNAVFSRVWQSSERSWLPHGMLRALTTHSNPLLRAEWTDGTDGADGADGAAGADGAEGSGGKRCIGGVLGWWGRDSDGSLFLFSQKLAVLPEHRGNGVARALKLEQARVAREHGVNEIRWTFDPMIAANASLNLRSLGATGIAYMVDLYGQRDDALNKDERTDRMLISWQLDQEPVHQQRGAAVANQTAFVRIPANYRALPAGRRTNERDRVREELTHAFNEGYRATSFEHETYRLERNA